MKFSKIDTANGVAINLTVNLSDKASESLVFALKEFWREALAEARPQPGQFQVTYAPVKREE